MVSGQAVRTAPTGAERWFYAPRNPNIPVPSNREIVATQAGPGGDGVAAYKGVGLPPAADYRSPWTFHVRKRNALPPDGAGGGQILARKHARAAGFHRWRGRGHLSTPRQQLAGNRTRCDDRRVAIWQARSRESRARAEGPVGASGCVCSGDRCHRRGLVLQRARSRPLRQAHSYLAVSVEDADGREASRTFGFASSCETFPAALFTARTAGRSSSIRTERSESSSATTTARVPHSQSWV